MFFNDKATRSRDLSSFASSSKLANGVLSDGEDGLDSKRRRIQRACDMCRLKKVRCEGGQPSRRACSNCISGKFDCTYLQTAKHEYRDKAYVQGLERRLIKLEHLLHKLCPDVDLTQDPDTIEAKSKARTSPTGTLTPPRLPSVATPVDADDVDSDDEELTARRTLADNLQNVSLDPGLPHFIGKSSGLMLLQTAIDFKGNSNGSPPMPEAPPPTEKKPAFWDSYTWSSRPSGPRFHFSFPDDDLVPALTNYYFKEFNSFNPLLHRPTFERHVAEGIHLSDEGFGATLLLVCALGARFSDDPRAFSGSARNPQDAGMQWFNQVQATLRVINHEPPRLYDLQIASLSSTFLHGLSAPQTSWPVLGHGIRNAQALGAHRRKVYNTMPPVERELLKRAFWALVKTDRDLAYHLGRPFAMQDEDFDVEFPIECDDEYWITDDPSQAFQQPEDKPSEISYFNAMIRLTQIQSFALRTIYSTSKSKVQLGHVGPQWEERTVMELDSTLNQWVDSLPQHLRFDPNQPSLTFLNQSVSLYAAYYNLQMIVHRPFLSPRRTQPTAIPSLAICTNAARSCLHILEVQYHRAKAENASQSPQIGAMFVSGLILLLNLWGAKRSGSNVNISKDMEYVHLAMNLLKALEPQWHVGGRMGDALFELVRAGDLPLPTDPASPYARALRAATDSTASMTKAEPGTPRVVNGHPPMKLAEYGPRVGTARSAGMPNGHAVLVRTDELGQQPVSTALLAPYAVTSEHRSAPIPWLSQLDGPLVMSTPPHLTQPGLSVAATEEFLRTLAEISGDSSGGTNQSSEADARGNMPIVPSGGDMLAMWSDVGAGLQWEEWGGYLAGFAPPSGAAEWMGAGQ